MRNLIYNSNYFDICDHLPPGLMIGLPTSAVVKGTLKSVADHNLAHEVLTAEEIINRFKVFQPAKGEIGVFENEAGYCQVSIIYNT